MTNVSRVIADVRQRDDRTPADADGPQERQRNGAQRQHAVEDAFVDAVQSVAIQDTVVRPGGLVQPAPHGPRRRRPAHPRPERGFTQPATQPLLP